MGNTLAVAGRLVHMCCVLLAGGGCRKIDVGEALLEDKDECAVVGEAYN